MAQITQLLAITKENLNDGSTTLNVIINQNLTETDMIMLVQALAESGEKFLQILNNKSFLYPTLS